MTVKLRILNQLVNAVRADLRRPHEFAYERVGFLYCKQSTLRSGALLMGLRYEPVRDDQYIPDKSVGARFDSSSIRAAMQLALTEGLSAFHVHLHNHPGVPSFSGTDRREMRALMPSFVNVRPDRLHGALVLSADSASARIWGEGMADGQAVATIIFVGSKMRFFRAQ